MSRVTRHSSVEQVLGHNVSDAIRVCEGLLAADTTSAIDGITDAIVRSMRAGGKVLLCGNGGSAVDAQHLAGELIGRFYINRPALPAISLSDNVAALTAISNDYKYEDVYVRAVQGLGVEGDVLIGLSTSGCSANVVAAVGAATRAGLVTVALVGDPDCPMAELADHVVCVAGTNTARIQEGHMLVGHTIFELVERELCAPS
jgi:D-sedoheptulose 7-phosphate isomerase